jgi:pSer/pThr/pTyr-binding forkhead associated (FHA) protein
MLAALAPPPEVVTDDMPYLETLDRSDEQLEYVLSRPRVVLGTASSSDIVVDSAFNGWQSVAPTHAELRREAEGYLLVDRGSENGTFVNDTRTGESILADGDTVRVGEVRFIFHIPSADQDS